MVCVRREQMRWEVLVLRWETFVDECRYRPATESDAERDGWRTAADQAVAAALLIDNDMEKKERILGGTGRVAIQAVEQQFHTLYGDRRVPPITGGILQRGNSDLILVHQLLSHHSLRLLAKLSDSLVYFFLQ